MIELTMMLTVSKDSANSIKVLVLTTLLITVTTIVLLIVITVLLMTVIKLLTQLERNITRYLITYYSHDLRSTSTCGYLLT